MDAGEHPVGGIVKGVNVVIRLREMLGLGKRGEGYK